MGLLYNNLHQSWPGHKTAHVIFEDIIMWLLVRMRDKRSLCFTVADINVSSFSPFLHITHSLSLSLWLSFPHSLPLSFSSLARCLYKAIRWRVGKAGWPLQRRFAHKAGSGGAYAYGHHKSLQSRGCVARALWLCQHNWQEHFLTGDPLNGDWQIYVSCHFTQQPELGSGITAPSLWITPQTPHQFVFQGRWHGSQIGLSHGSAKFLDVCVLWLSSQKVQDLALGHFFSF